MKTMVQDEGFLHTSYVYRDKNTNRFYFPDRSYVRQFLRHTIPVTLQVKATPTTIPITVAVRNTLRTGSFKLFKRPLPGFLTILTL